MAGPIYLILLDGGRYGHLYGPLSAVEPVNVLSGKDDSWANGELALGEPVFGDPYRDVVMASGPLVYWRFDEAVGPTAVDSSGNGFHGTYSGSPVFGEPGVDGSQRAVWFDGVNDYASVASPPLTSVSASIWFKAPSSPFVQQGFLVSMRSTFIIHPTPPNTVTWYIQRGTGWQSLANVPVSDITQWHNYVGTYDEVTGRSSLYIDGELVDTSVFGAGSLIVPSSPLSVGYDNGGGSTRKGVGVYDEFALYDRALTPLEVATHYAAAHAVYGPMIEDDSGAPVYTSSGVVI